MKDSSYFNKIHNRSADNIRSGDWFYINSNAIPVKVKRKGKVNIKIGVKLGIYIFKDFKNTIYTNFDYFLLRQATEVTKTKIYFNEENMIEVK